MLNNYDQLEQKIVGKSCLLSVKATDNKEKIATIRFTFAPVAESSSQGRGKAGNWKESTDFFLDVNSELISFGQLLTGYRRQVHYQFHKGKEVIIRRNPDYSVWVKLKNGQTELEVVLRDTDCFHVLTLVCISIADRYSLTKLEALTLLRSTPLKRE
ncbi:hypothetical protein HUO09_17470 [Vibrio sp. Y2-5]|uniref:hypothetical protein n=1 Tax=Vibrio sp. Y2-5 TaxID=2743977 RepID=UPI0016609A9A|nr:hypothetical protein [Vibrio sp. Y2-5]MBD0788147.1 hypothetical protein [Vibrio sp. Y2-5]